MHSDSLPELVTIEAAADLRVLVIAYSQATAPEWTVSAGRRFHVTVAPDLAAASELAAGTPIDVVVVDARVAAAELASIPQLRRRIGQAAVLLLAGQDADAAGHLLRELGPGACLLPADASPDLQAQVVTLAGERAWLARQRTRLLQDLTERNASLESRNRELDESRARFRDVIERNADAIVVVDRDGVIRFANGMAAELFRTPREDLAGTPFGFPVVAGGTTELDLLHPDGPAVVEMRVVESEWEGQAARIASLRDITERKRAEEDARRLIQERTARASAESAARRLHFLAEATTKLTLPLDYRETLSTLAALCVEELADWAVVYVLENGDSIRRHEVAHRDPGKADLVRALRDEPISSDAPHHVFEVLSTRSPVLIADVDDARLPTLAETDRHLELIRALGVHSYMLVPLVARGRGIGALALVSSTPARQFSQDDLTEAADLGLRAALAADNVRLYQDATEANRAKLDLLAVISHDLRTPLNSIMGHAELLTLGIPDKLSQAGLERVGRIRMGAAHLVYLIDELLVFTRLDSGREEVHLREVNARDAILEVSAVVEPLALERGLRFECKVPGSAIEIETDPDRLRQVLLNLVGNAIKYTERGEVRLELRDQGDGTVEFEVRDTGVGISPEHLGKIFEPFWQVDPTQRAANGGTGLGLSVVRGLVRLLGGEVKVQSVAGHGSTFTARFPRQRSGLPSGFAGRRSEER